MPAAKAPRTDTAQRLLDAGRRLFADQGVEATTVRDIVGAADVSNVAAVNYHFGSKDQLVLQVLADVLEPLDSQRLARLAAVEQPDLIATVEAWVDPMIELRHSDDGALAGHLFGYLVQPSSSRLWTGTLPHVEVVDRSFKEAFSQAVPETSEGEMQWRYGIALAAIIFYVIGALEPFATHAQTRRVDRERLVAVVVRILDGADRPDPHPAERRQRSRGLQRRRGPESR